MDIKSDDLVWVNDFIEERKTRKEVTCLGFNFSDLITEQ